MLQDNAPYHTLQVVKHAVREGGFGEIIHPPNSPDVASSGFFLFKFKFKKN